MFAFSQPLVRQIRVSSGRLQKRLPRMNDQKQCHGSIQQLKQTTKESHFSASSWFSDRCRTNVHRFRTSSVPQIETVSHGLVAELTNLPMSQLCFRLSWRESQNITESIIYQSIRVYQSLSIQFIPHKSPQEMTATEASTLPIV